MTIATCTDCGSEDYAQEMAQTDPPICRDCAQDRDQQDAAEWEYREATAAMHGHYSPPRWSNQ